MAKTHRKSRSASKKTKKGIYRSIKKSAREAVPVVTSGLKKVGKTSLKVAKKSRPIIEKGLGAVYGVLAEGFDMGVKGLKKGANVIQKGKKTRKNRKH